MNAREKLLRTIFGRTTPPPAHRKPWVLRRWWLCDRCRVREQEQAWARTVVQEDGA